MRIYSAATCSGAGGRRLPLDDLQTAIVILDQPGAAFHPVAVVAVQHAVEVADLGVMDMAADHAIDAALARFLGYGLLVVADIFDRVLDLVLEPCR
jgi:hypothetical protein